MRPFTPWGGVDSPSRGAVSPCLGFWFLNPSACQVCLHCIVYLVISCLYFAFSLRNHICFIPMFSLVILKNLCRYLWGWQKKQVGRLLFYLGNSKPLSPRLGLLLPYMLGLDIIYFLHKHVLLFFCLFFFQHKNK
jgi:hypothetical protein